MGEDETLGEENGRGWNAEHAERSRGRGGRVFNAKALRREGILFLTMSDSLPSKGVTVQNNGNFSA
jgi:hypothetical protein